MSACMLCLNDALYSECFHPQLGCQQSQSLNLKVESVVSVQTSSPTKTIISARTVEQEN